MNEHNLLIWEKLFVVDNDIIDEQHKNLFDIINKLYNAISKKYAHFIINEIIDELKKYANEHFTTEENIMDKINYPYIEEHKKDHQYFANKVVEYQKKIEQGDFEVPFNIIDFLSDWLRKHVLETDKKIAEYIKS